MKNNHVAIFFVSNYHQRHQNHEQTVKCGWEVMTSRIWLSLNQIQQRFVFFLERIPADRHYTRFSIRPHLCADASARRRSGILPGWRHTPRLCGARRHIDAAAARARGKWRAAAGWSTSLIWAFRSRTSGKAAVRSAKPGHTDKPVSCSAEEVSHRSVAERFQLLAVGNRLKVVGCSKVEGVTLVTASGVEGATLLALTGPLGWHQVSVPDQRLWFLCLQINCWQFCH